MGQHAGIVGAGVIGRLAAWRLAREGWRVSIFEAGSRDSRGTCSWVGAGMIAPYAELEKAEPVISRLGLRSLELWSQWLKDLPMPVFFQTNGSLVVAHRQDLPDLYRFGDTVRGRITDPATMRMVAREELATLEPELAGRFERGFYFPTEGQIEPRQLLPALDAAIPECRWHEHCRVTHVAPYEIRSEQEHHSFDLVVDTRGLAARDQPALQQLRGVRGELLRLRAPDVHLSRPIRLMHPRYPIYIVPRPDHHYLIGATQIESEHAGPVTVRSNLELLSAAYSLHPGFAEAEVLEQLVGLRPALPDNLPRLSYESGLLALNGLYRHGYLISPALVEEGLHLLAGKALNEIELVEENHVSTHG